MQLTKDNKYNTDFIIVIHVTDANTMYVLPFINHDLDFDIIESSDMPLALSLIRDKDNKNALLNKDNKCDTIKLLSRSVLNNTDIIYTEMPSSEAEKSIEDYTLHNQNKLSDFIESWKNSI